ncbi:uncharacterized protein FIBRA_04491 [Fibroporia radiculosa]|uniref:DUF1264-domain-containing protein n=1 Tax=Fibroporia radiculosa TaxID=599839 RepID=J4G7G9_9APHY|nr:uncharacterized protein FIBRA_04491 [Fibroporia radiculosa]CCM02393.1 predicted protein [Fibroporia radiculosa]
MLAREKPQPAYFSSQCAHNFVFEIMDNDTKASIYHSTPYMAAGSAMMSFKPISAIHQHLCAFHVYSQDRTRHLEAHHYCTHLSHDFHQCIIYDSDKPNAKLIGIEYIVSEELFDTLPQDEKKFWHSHQYEVESGFLQMQTVDLVPGVVNDVAEQPAMLQIQKTYGKTIHTWPVDTSPDLPIGPPNIMVSYTTDGQGPPPDFVKARDERCGMDTDAKRKLRAGYLPPYKKRADADQWEKTGKGLVFEPKEVDYKPYTGP